MTWIIQFTQNCIPPKVQVSQLRKGSASSECAMVPVSTQAFELITQPDTTTSSRLNSLKIKAPLCTS